MRVQFQAAVRYKGKFYFSSISINGLFVYDPEKGETKYLCSFKESVFRTLHRVAFIHDNEAWFLPQFGRKIICVNLDTLEQKVYLIPGVENLKESDMLYPEAIVLGECIYATPRGIRHLAIIDMKNHNVRFVNDFLSEGNEVLSIAGIRDNNIYYYLRDNNKRVILDTKSETYISEKSEEYNECMLSYLDDEILFISNNPDGECFINNRHIDYKLKKDFSRIVRAGEELYLFPTRENFYVKINLNNNSVEEFVLNENVARTKEIEIFLPIMGKDNMFFTSVFLGVIFCIKDNKIVIHKIDISEQEYEIARMKSMSCRDAKDKERLEYYEGDLITLQDYLKGIC